MYIVCSFVETKHVLLAFVGPNPSPGPHTNICVNLAKLFHISGLVSFVSVA